MSLIVSLQKSSQVYRPACSDFWVLLLKECADFLLTENFLQCSTGSAFTQLSHVRCLSRILTNKATEDLQPVIGCKCLSVYNHIMPVVLATGLKISDLTNKTPSLEPTGTRQHCIA